jgi:hypothetical protein
MVRLATVSSRFHAQVIAARLRADGIVTQLRGMDGLYPVGDVHVLVREDDLDRAAELLLVDEIEAVFEPGPDEETPGRVFGYPRSWLVVASLVVAAGMALSRLV